MSDDQYRLPTNVKPTHYALTIKTDLEKLVFRGTAEISLDVVVATERIVLNTSNLDLEPAKLRVEGKELTLSNWSMLGEQERITYTLPEALKAGTKATLSVSFKGEITGSLMGYYKSSWEDEGKAKVYALTQFQPTAARRAFPCWDEPLLKATFAIRMISRRDTVNLSNMPAISEGDVGQFQGSTSNLEGFFSSGEETIGWKVTQFDTTPRMSTYIVAFANGNFASLEDEVKMPLSGKTIPLRMYSTPDVIGQTKYALEVTKAVLPLYEQVFDVEYPLPKLDTLVVHDFDAGAMENWGLITGRTYGFLLDSDRADIASKKRVVGYQGHEVAHMWFGNITTPEWWDNLYLNEGFATLMGEVIIPGRLYPEFEVNSQFITEHLGAALDLDAKTSSHPIEVACPDANHINQIFDSLSYSKAASVLRMLANYVGIDKFLEGVSIYLKRNLYSNTVTHHLWEGISAATGVNITELMENWVTKIGFPVLTVKETEGGIIVRQDRFLETGLVADNSQSLNETIWNVPLSILTVKDGVVNVDQSPVLKTREAFFPLDTRETFKLNTGTYGVYRVLYTPERLGKIASEAAKGPSSVFTLDDRIGLLQDASALAKAGMISTSALLDLIKLWKDETSYLVWEGITDAVGSLLLTWWENEKVVDQLNAFRRELFTPLVEKLGYEYPAEESMDKSLLRTLAISQAANGGDAGVINTLSGWFAKYLEKGDETIIPPDLVAITYRIAVRHGGRREYDAVVKLHDTAKVPTQKIAAIKGMCSPRSLELVQETLSSLSTRARDQDIYSFFRELGSNFVGRRPLAAYFRERYEELHKRFEGNFTLQDLVTFSTNFFATKEDLKAVEAFFNGKDTSKYVLSLAQAIDTIKAHILYVERATEDLERWLGVR